MGSLIQDLRHGLRALRKSPGFTFSAVVVLALGIGANTAIFTVVNAVLLRPLPFADPARLVKVEHVPPARSFPGITRFSVSPANYLDWRAQNHVFEKMAAYGGRVRTLTGTDRPEAVTITIAEADFFSVVRAQAIVGRVFSAVEDQPGHDDVAVLSQAFAQTHFGSIANAVGQKLTLDGRSFTAIGVLPAKFQVRSWSPASTQMVVPLAWTDKDRAIRDNHNYSVVARLKPGVDLKQAQAEMNTISSNLEKQYPEEDLGWGAVVTPLHDIIVGDVRPALMALLGAVAFVLLIACANVANLVLARTMGRRKEMAIRGALGASRLRALQQVLSETLLVSLAGGALGLLLARFGMDLQTATLAKELPFSGEIALDGRVLAFTVVISLLTGMIAGLAPSWRLTRSDLNEALKQGLGRTDSDSGGARTRSALVVAEVALSLVLLIGAGLMIRSLWTLNGVDPGLDPHNLLTMRVSVPERKYPKPSDRNRFFGQLFQRVRALPGVDSAGTIDRLPMTGGGSHEPIVIEGRPADVFAVQPVVDVRQISPGYLRAMRIPLRGGRDFSDADTEGGPAVILISESMARQFWPGENPVGKHLTISFSPKVTREVVGVVGDVKDRGVDIPEPVATLYDPLFQEPLSGMSLVVRTALPPANLVSAITDVLHQLDRELPVRDVIGMEEILAESLFQRRFSMLLLAAFAGLALLLAAVGIYSVLSYTVRRRMREISVRMALGAQVEDVLRIVVIEGMKPTLIGVAIGLLGALALGEVLSKLVFGVKTTDPVTFAAVSLLLAAVAFAASVIPAWRATKVDPIQALREE
ncbi:MAG TPA: ABC transporter permease [Bryobacteraceae bacterium]|jgi:predicted permease|nr:ABC transporter permease [Bryobacteraceae bacterium]